MNCKVVVIIIVCLSLQTALMAQDINEDKLPRKLESLYLPNPVVIRDKIISGGLPDGDAAFRELANLGVRTIISVDGATPDVSMAKMYGMRYVHLPHGYDGIPQDRLNQLAKAVRDLDGVIYIHCHHGKHRSPAAAAAACVSAGLIPTSSALPILELAGTSKSYRGLYQSAAQAVALDPAILDHLQVEFQESVQLRPIAEAMVALGLNHERLQILAKANWKPPADHPDLDPVHEALMLQEHFSELIRTEEVAEKPTTFRAMLKVSESAAKQLKDSLIQLAANRDLPTLEKIIAASTRISDNCMNCHQQFRDMPLGDKH